MRVVSTFTDQQTHVQGRQHAAIQRGAIDRGYRRVMVWVNHSEALVAFYAGNFPDEWMEVYGDGPRPNRIGNWLVHRVESRHHGNPKSFHDEIARHLTSTDAVLLLGAGRARQQLARYLAEDGSRRGHVVHLDPVANPTEAELLARAESFFRLRPVQ